jgi:hypothetical protein
MPGRMYGHERQIEQKDREKYMRNLIIMCSTNIANRQS